MEWTLKLEHRDSEGTLHSSTLATIDRPELINEAGLGERCSGAKSFTRAGCDIWELSFRASRR